MSKRKRAPGAGAGATEQGRELAEMAPGTLLTVAVHTTWLLGTARAESWAVPGRHGTDPSCFGLNRAGPIRHGILPGRAVLGLRPETTAQHGPKARRATFGPCQPKHGPQIMNTTI